MASKKISLIIVLFLINLASASLYYNISIDYNNKNLNITSVSVIYSNNDLNLDNYGDYNLTLFDSRNKKIYNQNFIIPNTIFYDTSNEEGLMIDGGMIILKNLSFEVFVPYNKNAEEINIYNNEKIIAKKSIDYLSTNKINQNTNNNLISTENKESGNNYIWIILIAIILIIILVLFIIFKKYFN